MEERTQAAQKIQLHFNGIARRSRINGFEKIQFVGKAIVGDGSENFPDRTLSMAMPSIYVAVAVVAAAAATIEINLWRLFVSDSLLIYSDRMFDCSFVSGHPKCAADVFLVRHLST